MLARTIVLLEGAMRGCGSIRARRRSGVLDVGVRARKGAIAMPVDGVTTTCCG